ncbi:N-acetylmuramic acid 6-phosphate etherase [Spiroplasma endosymbiont of Aspidapion aeneum]|uniref:N-acetylmuramic acid 6-phosphate etherase n=1 Tax=Spiroplasma endosymbiont of Aspidapion aeneum TaxID=3066276 RepID=UPI00313DEB46
MKIKNIDTEERNINTIDIDKCSSIEIIKLINNEDKKIAYVIEENLEVIAKGIDLIFDRIKNNGRVFYIGAGTSGRIGILDASEILPTYNDANTFYGIIAGGDRAIKNPIEGAEDSENSFAEDISSYNLCANDVIIGIGASGMTPYVVSALKYAKKNNLLSIGLCMSNSNIFNSICDLNIKIITGPEAITGSTRMKAGTATKMICNMISTAIMIKKGKVYSNLMVDLKASNEKLRKRCVDIFMTISLIKNKKYATKILIENDWNIRKSLEIINKNK